MSLLGDASAIPTTKMTIIINTGRVSYQLSNTFLSAIHISRVITSIVITHMAKEDEPLEHVNSTSTIEVTIVFYISMSTH